MHVQVKFSKAFYYIYVATLHSCSGAPWTVVKVKCVKDIVILMSSTTYSHTSRCCLHINVSVIIIFLLFYRPFHSLHTYVPNITCTLAFLDSVSHSQPTSTLTLPYIFSATTNVYVEVHTWQYLVCYPSVHCGLPASRVRSRAHLLKSVNDEMRDLCVSGGLADAVSDQTASVDAGLHAGIVQSLVWW